MFKTQNANVVIFRSPDATETATETAPKAETKPAFVPQSEKLTQLKADYKAAFIAIGQIDDPFSDAAKNAKLNLLKLDGDISTEIAALNKAEKSRIEAEQRNERIAMVTRLLDLHAVLLKLPAKATDEQKAAAQSEFDGQRDAVQNELLARFSGNKPAATTTGEATSGRDTASKAEILELARSGKTFKEIEALGHKRSTVWHTVDKARKAGETFPNIK